MCSQARYPVSVSPLPPRARIALFVDEMTRPPVRLYDMYMLRNAFRENKHRIVAMPFLDFCTSLA
jgi:hypothetical protein